MTDIEIARNTIDSVDKEMAALFIRRMEAVKIIAQYKAKNGIPVYDAKREAEVIEKNASAFNNKDFAAHYVGYLQAVMNLSKQYQSSVLQGMRIAFCGVEGAFANIAAAKIFPDGRLISYPDFASAYNAVTAGECDCCVLPIENSTAGEVGQVVDLMFGGSLFVNGVYSLPIRHHLLGLQNAHRADIRKVVSHPQALMQCSKYISDHQYETLSSSNTAAAAKLVSMQADVSVAAIASKETAALYGLRILDHDINEKSVNTTRFAVFSRSQREHTAADDHFILLFTVNNQVGALAKAVNIISAHGFDMRVLRSRPVKDVPWQYYFYVEIKGDQASDEGKRMQRELSVCCEKLRIAGRFPDDVDLS